MFLIFALHPIHVLNQVFALEVAAKHDVKELSVALERIVIDLQTNVFANHSLLETQTTYACHVSITLIHFLKSFIVTSQVRLSNSTRKS